MNLKIEIDPKVYQKIMYWVDRAKTHEVGGLGVIQLGEEGAARVVDAMLLPQRNGATSTDIEPEDVAAALYDFRDSQGEIKFWWHSHVQMPVFWSGTDMDTIKSFGQGGWIIATVFNQKREMRSAFYSPDGIETPWGKSYLFLDELPTQILGEAIPEAWEADYVKNVTEQSQTFGRRWEDTEHLPSLVYDKRPPGISKKAWKRAKKTPKQACSADPAQSIDDYGLTQEERTFLATSGYDIDDITKLVEADATPTEILKMAEFDIPAQTALDLLASRYTPEDILAEHGSVAHLDALGRIDAMERGHYYDL